jgi:hypothetical protein
MAMLRCANCGDDFDPDVAGGGYWGERLICGRCERDTLGPTTDAMNAVVQVLSDAGMERPERVANDVFAAILKSGCVITGFQSLLEQTQAFRTEIAELKAELGRH